MSEKTYLNKETIDYNKTKIIAELKQVRRVGMNKLLEYLDESRFYIQASSTRHHQAYEGGNAEHSVQVFDILDEMNYKLSLGIPQESITICSLLHDICKTDCYKKTDSGYVWNHDSEPGHGAKSVKIISSFIELTKEEKDAIAYHMGAYEKQEFGWEDLSQAYRNNNLSFYLHVADMRSTYGF